MFAKLRVICTSGSYVHKPSYSSLAFSYLVLVLWHKSKSRNIAPFTQHNSNAIRGWFMIVTSLFVTRLQFGSSNHIWNFWRTASPSTIFEHLWQCSKGFGSCKQNQVFFDDLRASLAVLGGFLDNVKKTKKKTLLNNLCHLVVWMNQRLQTQVCHSYCSRIVVKTRLNR